MISSVPLSKSLLVRAELPPANLVYPILGHGMRQTLFPALRRHASNKSPVAVSSPLSRLVERDYFSPFDSMFPMHRRYDDIHSELMDLMKDMDMMNQQRWDRFFPSSAPGYSITRDDKNVKLAVELPGVKKEDIKIEIKDDRLLQISGHRKTVQEDGSSVSEFKFDKRFNLGKTLDRSKVTAQYADGLLTISAPVADEEAVQTQTIPVMSPEKPLDEFDESDDIEATKVA